MYQDFSEVEHHWFMLKAHCAFHAGDQCHDEVIRGPENKVVGPV